MASPFASVSRSLAFRCGRQAPFPISDLLETTKCARQPLNQTVWPSGWHSQPRYFLSDLSCGRADQIEHFQTTRFASLTRSCVTQTSFDPSLRSTRSTSPCHYRPSNRLRTTPSQRLPIAQVQSFATSPQRPFFWPFRNKSRSQSKETQKEYTTPYRPKREWPPDMSQLSKEQRFRLERKYRRRAKLKYERPNWDKWTKIVQWSLIGCMSTCTSFIHICRERWASSLCIRLG